MKKGNIFLFASFNILSKKQRNRLLLGISAAVISHNTNALMQDVCLKNVVGI